MRRVVQGGRVWNGVERAKWICVVGSGPQRGTQQSPESVPGEGEGPSIVEGAGCRVELEGEGMCVVLWKVEGCGMGLRG